MKKNKRRKWTQRDGTKVRLENMDNQHLWNCFAMANRNELVVVQRMFDYGLKAFEFPDDEVIQRACHDAIDATADSLSTWPDSLLSEILRRDMSLDRDLYTAIHERGNYPKKSLLSDINFLLEHDQLNPPQDHWEDPF